jgi:hypothetical protein
MKNNIIEKNNYITNTNFNKTNLKNTNNILVKLSNKNKSNKNYKNNLEKLSNKKQISIFIRSLEVKTRQLKKIISN